jgi:hypothetical protein
MSTSKRLTSPTIAVLAILIGAALVLLLVLLGGRENVRNNWGPVLLAFWIAGVIGGYMMAWIRSGLGRLIWCALATFLLLALMWPSRL